MERETRTAEWWKLGEREDARVAHGGFQFMGPVLFCIPFVFISPSSFLLPLVVSISTEISEPLLITVYLKNLHIDC
jgi:hypothetical protein